jgi:hypothetical protein
LSELGSFVVASVGSTPRDSAIITANAGNLTLPELATSPAQRLAFSRAYARPSAPNRLHRSRKPQAPPPRLSRGDCRGRSILLTTNRTDQATTRERGGRWREGYGLSLRLRSVGLALHQATRYKRQGLGGRCREAKTPRQETGLNRPTNLTPTGCARLRLGHTDSARCCGRSASGVQWRSYEPPIKSAGHCLCGLGFALPLPRLGSI